MSKDKSRLGSVKRDDIMQKDHDFKNRYDPR